MKLVTFSGPGPRAGVIAGRMILDINSARPSVPSRVLDILRNGLLPEVADLAGEASGLDRKHFRPLEKARLYPPIPEPGKIVCLGLNYEDHAREQARRPPDRPMLFAKAPTALTGPEDDIVIPEGIGGVDAEAELAVVIGKKGRDITVSSAAGYAAGYMAFNDVSARVAQKEDRQWFRAKSFDSFAPCGPWIVTSDEIADPGALKVEQRLNGAVMQKSSTSNLIFGISEIISYISRGMTLMPGDIISTGTPAGVGVFRHPPVFLKEGDLVEIEVEGIGILRNRVRIEGDER